jgi:hypothetical protein
MFVLTMDSYRMLETFAGVTPLLRAGEGPGVRVNKRISTPQTVSLPQRSVRP